ncbi:hypothetical protein MLD38_034247 [Melastoma candidum]|uniref:Uncharacterized protein n=1 Tax=Melastoma candidum TaxID=119954 RepID=A0ACB9M9B8_9MYRT|nr:hypothetical protein MLD38_034247 [Melastoma candidum]
MEDGELYFNQPDFELINQGLLNSKGDPVIHTEAYIGRSKVESAAVTCRAINSSLEVIEHREALRTSNALEILSKYDILTVYNYKGGPCYRCLFPTPPPTTACQRCSDSGVLGVVPGVIGCLQALEAIKIARTDAYRFLYDYSFFVLWVVKVKIRGRCLQCEACGENSEFSRQYFKGFDYEKFTQSPMSTSAPVKLNLLGNDSRITTKDYSEIVRNGKHTFWWTSDQSTTTRLSLFPT